MTKRGKRNMDGYVRMRIVALSLLVITVGAEIAETSGKITIWQLLVVNIASIIIMATLVIFML